MSSAPARALTCASCGGPLDPERRACAHCGAVCQTRRCAGCLALNIAGDRNCRACGRLLPAEISDAAGAPVLCPACGAAMKRRQAGASSFNECDQCGGLWLTPQTLTALNSQAETRAELRPFDEPESGAGEAGAAPRIAYRKCPACLKFMNRDALAAGSGVVLDLCRHHGSFFDHGELTRLLAFIEGGGLEKSRRREAELLKSEVGELKRRQEAARVTSLGMSAEWEMRKPALAQLIRWVADLCRRA